MIVYQLTCGQGHLFEGWFASAEAFDRQSGSGQLQCPTCSTPEVRKLPSAPHVHTAGSQGPATPKADEAQRREALFDQLRNFILTNTEDVGRKFAEVARRIHYQEEDARNIRGVVTPDEAAELREEGVETLAITPGLIPSEEVH
jgi:hypothetical protein